MAIIVLQDWLTRRQSASSIGNSIKISNTDTLLSSKIANYEYDYEKVKKAREQTSQHILKIKSMMTRIDERELKKLEGETIEETRAYERLIRRQLLDVAKIILYLRKLVENEFYEIVYDLRGPLVVFDEFILKLDAAIRGMALDKKTASQMNSIVEGISSDYEKIVEYTIEFVEKDFSYYKTLDPALSGFSPSGKKITLAQRLRNRTKIKRQINGKAQSILMGIESIVARLKEHGLVPGAPWLIAELEGFKKAFNGLLVFSEQRVKIANSVIIESIALQREYYKDLERMKKELDTFYKQFISKQERIAASQDEKISVIKQKHAQKWKEEFEDYQGKVADELKSFDKAYVRKIAKLEKRDIAAMKKERTIAGKDVKNLQEDVKEAEKKVKEFEKSHTTTSLFLKKVAVLILFVLGAQVMKAPPIFTRVLEQKKDIVVSVAVGTQEQVIKEISDREAKAGYEFEDIGQQEYSYVENESIKEISTLTRYEFAPKFTEISMTDKKEFDKAAVNPAAAKASTFVNAALSKFEKKAKRDFGLGRKDAEKIFYDANEFDIEIFDVVVTGHTCIMGGWERNFPLSENRAKDAAEKFKKDIVAELEKQGINPGSINIVIKETKGAGPITHDSNGVIRGVIKELNESGYSISYEKIKANDAKEVDRFDGSMKELKEKDLAKFTELKDKLKPFRSVDISYKIKMKTKINAVKLNIKEKKIQQVSEDPLYAVLPERDNIFKTNMHMITPIVRRFGGFNPTKRINLPRTEPSRSRYGRGANAGGHA